MVDVTSPVPANTVVGVLIGGKLYGLNLLSDTAGADAMGLVAATPDPNTLLGRVKAIVTALTAGPKTGATSLSVVPPTDGFTVNLSTAAQTALAAAAPASTYVPVTAGSGNLANGACRAIVAEVAGRANLKQPDGTARVNYPLQAGLNPIGALVIDVPTSGTAASGLWAIYA